MNRGVSLQMFDAMAPNCRRCGDCCQNVIIALGQGEADVLRDAGTALIARQTADPEMLSSLKRGQAFYDMIGRCAYSDIDPTTDASSCSNYSQRPAACRDFPEGGFGCRQMQARAGTISREAFEIYLRSSE